MFAGKFWGGLAVAAGVALAACKADPPAVVPPSHTAVAVGYSALRISLPIFVAQERGMFSRHGLHVTLQRYETAQPLVEDLLDGRLHAGGYAAFPIILGAAARGGQGVRLATVMQEDEAHPVSYLLKRANDGALQNIEDLRGKRVGILPTTAYAHWVKAVLGAAGLVDGDVTVTPVAPPLQVAMLREGGVDALFTNDPMATAALASGVAQPLGLPAPVPRALGGPIHFGAFMLSAGWVKQQPEAAIALVKALDEAITWANGNQVQARRTMANHVRPEERDFLDRYPDALFLHSGAFTQQHLTAQAAQALRMGILKRPLDVTGWVLSAPAGLE